MGHPGTGSWLCLKMFFLEAGSYVLPRRNENKAPKGSSGSLGAALRCCSALGPAGENLERGSVQGSKEADKVGPGMALPGQSRSLALPGPGAPYGPLCL